MQSKKNTLQIQNEFNDFIQNMEKTTGITGISFSLHFSSCQNRENISINSGLQSKQGKDVTDKSLFQIGSNSKVFLCIVMLQLEEEGKLSLEDKVGKFFQLEYKNWQNISIKQLLNMTSKIPNFTDGEDSKVIQKLLIDPSYDYSSYEILNSVSDEKLVELNWNYSNTNYVLAAKIIEYVTKTELSTEIQNRILKKIHLNHTYYINTLPKSDVLIDDIENLMSGYFYENEIDNTHYNGVDIINFNMSRLRTAGSIVSNPSDMNTFLRFLFESEKLLSKNQFRKMTLILDQNTGNILENGVNSEYPLGYGLGLEARYILILKQLFMDIQEIP